MLAVAGAIKGAITARLIPLATDSIFVSYPLEINHLVCPPIDRPFFIRDASRQPLRNK